MDTNKRENVLGGRLVSLDALRGFDMYHGIISGIPQCHLKGGPEGGDIVLFQTNFKILFCFPSYILNILTKR